MRREKEKKGALMDSLETMLGLELFCDGTLAFFQAMLVKKGGRLKRLGKGRGE